MPLTFADLLAAPAFVVNMDACTDRWAAVVPRLASAGFTSVERWPAVDARNPADLARAWAAVGNPPFDPRDVKFTIFPGKQGCTLSHLLLWRHIAESGAPYAVVFEDDAFFHERWHELAPAYMEATPANWDILYMGAQLAAPPPSAHIARVPVFCTHAYVVTAAGAQRLYDALMTCATGFSIVDCMLIHYMKIQACPFNWYVWNATMYPDVNAAADNKEWAQRNHGLVFQDATMGSFVEPT